MQLKYRSAQIGAMDEALFQKHAKALLLKINVITGWSLPETAEMANVIVDQFQKLLREEFSELNVDEIEHAFRTRCDTVEDWGKNLNLSLVNKILKPYLKERYYISDMEERLKTVDDGYCDQASLNYWRERIEKEYQAYLAGAKPDPYWYAYDILVQDGFIERNFYKATLKKLQQSDDYAGDEVASRQAKALCVSFLFAHAKKNHFGNIYKKG